MISARQPKDRTQDLPGLHRFLTTPARPILTATSSYFDAPTPKNVSLSATIYYGLFVAAKRVNSFIIKQIQTLLAKHPGWGHFSIAHLWNQQHADSFLSSPAPGALRLSQIQWLKPSRFPAAPGNIPSNPPAEPQPATPAAPTSRPPGRIVSRHTTA